MTTLDLRKIVIENWFENKALSVLEFSFTLHHSVFPVANINVTVTRIRGLLWPDEATIAMFDPIYKTTSIFTTVGVNHVTFTRFLIEDPLAGISALSISVNLNSKTVTNRLNLVFIFI